MTWYLEHIFRKLTLQTGVVLLSVIFINLAVCVLLVNALYLDTQHPLPWIIMFMFVCCMAATWSIACTGAFKETIGEITTATVLWSFYVIVWTCVVVWSFAGARDKTVCIGSRCPDVLWLVNNGRGTGQAEDQYMNSVLRWRQIKDIMKNKGQVPQYSKVLKYLYGNRNAATTTVENESPRLRRDKRNNVTISDATPAPLSNATGRHFERLLELRALNGTRKPFCGSRPTPNYPGSVTISVIISIAYTLTSLFSWLVLISYRREIEFQTTNP